MRGVGLGTSRTRAGRARLPSVDSGRAGADSGSGQRSAAESAESGTIDGAEDVEVVVGGTGVGPGSPAPGVTSVTTGTVVPDTGAVAPDVAPVTPDTSGPVAP